MSNPALAIAARKAIRDPDYTEESGFCQQFVRKVIQSVYGDRYDAYRAPSAKLAAGKWQATSLALTAIEAGPYQEGDILYKTSTSGEFGHVGIYVGRLYLADGDQRGYVAENSSTPIGRISGAKGYRPIGKFGKVDLVVRLAPPAPVTPIAYLRCA